MQSILDTNAALKAQKHARAVELLSAYFTDDTGLARLLKEYLPNALTDQLLAEELVTRIAECFGQMNIVFDPEQIVQYVKSIQTTPTFREISGSPAPHAQIENGEARNSLAETDQDSATRREERSSENSRFFEDLAAEIFSQFKSNTNRKFKDHFYKKYNSTNRENMSNNVNNPNNRSALELALETNLRQAEIIDRQQRQIEELLRENRLLTQETQKLQAKIDKQEIHRLKEALAKPLHVLPVTPSVAPRPKSPVVPWSLNGNNPRDIRDMGPAPRDSDRTPSNQISDGSPNATNNDRNKVNP